MEMTSQIDSISADRGRRSFLRWAGVTAVAAVAFGADIPGLKLNQAFAQSRAVDLGGGDLGVLNYAYALEQLEAAFYTQVIATPYAGMSGYERTLLTDIRNHEVSHREFFKKALGANRIPDLQVNFSAVNFGDRASVLKTAMTFEDLGVSAYNGGGAAIQNPKYLAAAGSIVSVEARHAATIRDMMMPFTQSFAGDDVITRGGVDVSNPPSAVLRAAGPFIATPVTASQLP
nr:ferritin-like domain-containing protein [Methylobacterium sp. ZNC0032]